MRLSQYSYSELRIFFTGIMMWFTLRDVPKKMPPVYFPPQKKNYREHNNTV